MLRVKAYKVKDKNVVVIDKNFLNATEADFEQEEYVLYIPKSKIEEWAEKLKNTKGLKSN